MQQSSTPRFKALHIGYRYYAHEYMKLKRKKTFAEA